MRQRRDAVSEEQHSFANSGAWYTAPGPEQDVIFSTRVRLSRNLANFPFPRSLRVNDGERVRSLVLQTLADMPDARQYQAVDLKRSDPLQRKILAERGIAPFEDDVSDAGERQDGDQSVPSGVIVRADGKVSCLVNGRDHLCVSAFAPGINADGAWAAVHAVDEAAQQSLQFAASREFGFLTASLSDAGTGMKAAFQAHLPAISLSGQISAAVKGLSVRGFSVEACYGAGGTASSLGAFYLVENAHSFSGSEADQVISLAAAARYIADFERKSRALFAEDRPTVLCARVCRSYGAAHAGKFLSEREAVSILSDIKLGTDTGLVSGLEAHDFAALLFRVKNAHLTFVAKSGRFSLESDVESDPSLIVPRVRSLVLHEALEGTELKAGVLPE